MNCPRCNNRLKRSKNDPSYGLCYNCKKKFKWIDESEFDNLHSSNKNIKKTSSSRSVSKKKKNYFINVLSVFAFLICIFIIFSLLGGDNIDAQKNESNVDIDKCIADFNSNLQLEPDYSFVEDYYIKCDDKDLTISIVVDDATNPAKALDFADTIVRQLNFYASMQDESIASSSNDSCGGLYDEYTALVGIAPLSKLNNQDEWFAYCAIVSSKSKLKLNKQYQ